MRPLRANSTRKQLRGKVAYMIFDKRKQLYHIGLQEAKNK